MGGLLDPGRATLTPRSRAAPGWAVAALWAYFSLGLLSSVLVFFWHYRDGIFLDSAAGVWATLARDLTHGEFYRPLVDDRGYGGTRYMPLFFVLHSLLLRVGGDVHLTGWVLMQASVLFLAVVLYALLRRMEVGPRLAFPLAGSVYATVMVQQICLGLRADYLAAALAVASIYCSLRRWDVLCGLCLWLAFLTKVTAVYPLLPIVGSLWSLADRKAAMRLAAGVGVACAASLVAIQWASAGTFWTSFQAAATGGGSWLYAFGFGERMLAHLYEEPFEGTFSLLALAWWIFRPASARPLIHLFFGAALLSTLIIHLSLGIWTNHLIDLQAASILLVGEILQAGGQPARWTGLFLAGLAGAWAISLLMGVPSTWNELLRHGRPTLAGAREVRAMIPPGTRYLAGTATLPLLFDERPVLMDDFNFRHQLAGDTAVSRDFWPRLKAREFPLVVLAVYGLPFDAQVGDPAIKTVEARIWDSQWELACLRPYYSIVRIRRPFVLIQLRT